MENLNDIMQRLTWLKNSGETTAFGNSADEREIKTIDSILRIFGVEWSYQWEVDHWAAKMSSPT